MAGKTLIDIQKPTTQTVEAVKALLAWRGHPTNPLPTDVSLENGRMVLVLSNKRDAYYCVTAKECSCPARNWHANQPCKHMRKHFAEQTAKPTASKPGSIRPAGKWPGGMNGPVDPDELKRLAKAEA